MEDMMDPAAAARYAAQDSTLPEDRFQEYVRKFSLFFDHSHETGDYRKKIRDMISNGENRLMVSIDDVRRFDKTRTLFNGLLKEPMDFLPAMEEAVRQIVHALADTPSARADLANVQFHVGLGGSFGEHYVNPRTLSSKHLGRTICIEGIVTKVSLVRPKVAKSVHYCEATEQFHMREYRDATTLGNAIPTPAVYPKTDDRNNRLTTEFGYCVYRDHQTISIQEMPERAPAGQLPRPIDVILDDDLVDAAKPGDRVCISGVYRSVGKTSTTMSAAFRTIILANSVSLLNRDMLAPELSEMDEAQIQTMAQRDDIFELLSNSLAPSIYNTANMRYIKKAVLLQLLGGMEKNLPNGTHIRGDINVLMVGDPSTAKSQMLRFVYNLAPLAVTTTGRGSSGVGLTAAVTTDRETGERRLEAGAMVLADRGIVCIDEFDKMSDNDRVAIHEVMEQQTVTIAKAGIHTTLNARCSVIAAANPAYGQYIDRRRPFENIALPDSLLSRFDLLFIVCDEVDEEYDRMISEHVLRMHRYIPPNLEEGMPIPNTYSASFSTALANSLQPDEEEDAEPFERFNSLLHSALQRRDAAAGDAGAHANVLKLNFVKKYLHYAKHRMRPVLTEDATEFIASTYAELRNRRLETEQHRMEKTLPVTARMLETLIRLATAHAKCRLSQRVERTDAEIANELLEFVLYKEVKRDTARQQRTTKKRRTAAEAASEPADGADAVNGALSLMQLGNGSDDVFDAGAAADPAAAAARRQRVPRHAEQPANAARPANTSSSRGHLSDLVEPSSQLMTDGPGAVELPAARLALFRTQLDAFRNAANDLMFPLGELSAGVNAGLAEPFSPAEISAALSAMQDANQVMLTDDGHVAII